MSHRCPVVTPALSPRLQDETPCPCPPGLQGAGGHGCGFAPCRALRRTWTTVLEAVGPRDAAWTSGGSWQVAMAHGQAAAGVPDVMTVCAFVVLARFLRLPLGVHPLRTLYLLERSVGFMLLLTLSGAASLFPCRSELTRTFTVRSEGPHAFLLRHPAR